MSVVICYNTNDLSLVVTDTRITCSDGDFTDNNEKLVKLPIGWCAGVGASGFLDEIKDKLIANNINVECDIINAYSKVYNNYNNSVYTQKQIDMSALAISYFPNNKFKTAILNNEYIKRNKYICGYNYIHILYPIEYLQEPNLMDYLNKQYPLKCDVGEYLNKAIRHILKIFKEIKYNCMSVSSVCDIGGMYLKGNLLYKFRIKNDVDILLKNVDELLTDIENNNDNDSIIENEIISSKGSVDEEYIRNLLRHSHREYKEEDFDRIYETMVIFNELDENSQTMILEEIERLKNK
ncbi:hypothetical protein [Clostridium botulinum]|uniref:hypothetical protein n=1 Tax=Clostridium botulinum TaxID=1491 RepID=UPI003DA2D851